MLYYPRSGSTSILRYFEKLKPEYTIINQPWSPLVSQLESRLKISYSEIISHKDVLVKSTIPLFLSKDIPPETIQNDFDKIIQIYFKKSKVPDPFILKNYKLSSIPWWPHIHLQPSCQNCNYLFQYNYHYVYSN